MTLAATTHDLYYPSQVVLLAPDGRLLHEYWHSGHLNHLQAADLDGNGRIEFVLGRDQQCAPRRHALSCWTRITLPAHRKSPRLRTTSSWGFPRRANAIGSSSRVRA